MWQHQNSGAGGGAHVVLACWWGNGLPRLRCLAGVGARPAPLELRHCPDSYGRLQSRIFGNGRKSDRATPRGGRRPSGCKLLSGGSKGNLNYPLKKHGLSSCQQPRQDEPCERCSESLGLKGAQAEGQVRGEIPQLNWGSAPDTDFLEEGRGTWNYWWSGEMRRDQQERRWRKRRAGPFLTLRRESQGSERDQIPRQSTPQTMHTRSGRLSRRPGRRKTVKCAAWGVRSQDQNSKELTGTHTSGGACCLIRGNAKNLTQA
eukprot:TRINITY_DN25_c0_g1_i7.p1 TRINITY_DN25_c0_g1~~TRINITY_DN25_c0_g1_i7.p1  ORF type:complete len:260 (-),score=-1.41 TRINITY_DN25_c0_g1_i7:8-787(-)